MSVVYLQERIKKLEEQVQELEAELTPYREVKAKDMPKLRERPGEYWSYRGARSAVPVRDLRDQEVQTDNT